MGGRPAPGVGLDKPDRREPVTTPYSPRPIRYIDTWSIKDWLVKVHGINAHLERGDDPIDAEVAEECLAIAQEHYRFIEALGHHRIGFAVIHQGGLANWLLLNWWTDEILCHSRLYRADHADPTNFQHVSSDLLACIWEMHVVEFERQAWIDAMVRNPDGPSEDTYLGAQLNVDV